jgi:hypothetical protein
VESLAERIAEEISQCAQPVTALLPEAVVSSGSSLV